MGGEPDAGLPALGSACRSSPHALFISDLHLSGERPEITDRFLRFCATVTPPCATLYILGDLFEFWVGDDTVEEPLNRVVCGALRAVTDSGVNVDFMQGNRDFLAGTGFCAAANARVLPDPSVVDLWGTPTLLLHGDTLCTDDHAYQAFRRQVRNPEVQRQFLSLPVPARQAQVGQTRAASEREKQVKADDIMDVAPGTVEDAFREHGCARMIHGHTHRPALHETLVDGLPRERWVLSDWTPRRSDALCVSADGVFRLRIT